MSRRDLGQIEEVSPGVWRVRLSAGYDPLTGKRRRPRATVYGNRKDAERKLAEMIGATGKGPSATTSSLGVYLNSRYIPWLQDRVRDDSLRQNTYEQYERYLLIDAAPLHHLPMDELQPWPIEQWLGRLAQRGLSGQSRLHVYRALRTALRRAVRWQLLDADPMARVDPPKADPHVPKPLTVDDAIRVLQHFVDHRLDLFVNIALGCGVRRSENLALTWDTYDGESFEVLGAYHGKGRFERTKNATSTRRIYLPHWVVKAVERAHPDGPPSTGWVHCWGGDLPPSPGQVSAAFRRHAKAIGIDMPLKDLRHSYGTLSLESGVDVVVVSGAMGHAKVSTTTGFYVKPHDTSRKAAAATFGDHLDPSRRSA